MNKIVQDSGEESVNADDQYEVSVDNSDPSISADNVLDSGEVGHSNTYSESSVDIESKS